MSGLSASPPATPDLLSFQTCGLAASGAGAEIEQWNGSEVIIRTLIGGVASEDNRTGCGGVNELSCSWTETETKTLKMPSKVRQSKTQTAPAPKETDSRLAQLGLVIALLGVFSVVV
jgi:hypothetical protein